MITLKIPFELGIIDKERRGTSMAPDLLARDLSAIEVPVYDDFTATSESICVVAVSAMKSALENSEKVLAIGGDHSITYSLMKAFSQVHKNACLLFFDAHFDCEDDFLPPSHEDIIKAAVNEGFFKPENILIVGARKWTQKDLEFIQTNKIKYIASKDIDQDTITRVQEFIKPFDSMYLSIDIDVFDSEDAPGTGWPEPNGPDKKLLLNIFKKLSKSEKLKSVDLVEVSPPLDKEGKTVSTAIELLKLFATPKG